MDTGQLLLRLSPIIGCYLLGVGLSRRGVTADQVAWVFRLALQVGLPALVISTVPGLMLVGDLIWLPLAALLCHLLLGGLCWLILSRHLQDNHQRGVALSGAMIMNIAAVYPFVFAVWGLTGASYLLLIDVGNALLTLSLVYTLCCWHGRGRGQLRRVLGLVLAFPPLWTLGVAVAMNLLGWRLPHSLEQAGGALAGFILLLVLVALGIHSRWPPVLEKRILRVALLRCGGGLIVGVTLSRMLELPEVAEAVLILACAAPVGFNTLVFAVREGLDREYAANLVSLSLLCALVYLPLLVGILINT